MSKCIFCKIIRKKAPASVIYEDEKVLAFLSNQPVNQGHSLVIPKNHYESIFDISDEEVAYLFKIVKRIAHSVRDATETEGIRIVQNNGEAAGQVIFHLHVHIIPMQTRNRFSHDGAFRDSTNYQDAATLEKYGEKIRNQLLKKTETEALIRNRV
jgi:histidine triad (HIT) family protein